MTISIQFFLWLLLGSGCSKKSAAPTGPDPVNHSPIGSITATIIAVSHFKAELKVVASDADNDALSYTWDFGEGRTKTGNAEETFVYAADKTFTVKVAVTDGKSPAVNLIAVLNTTVTNVTIDATQKFQAMEGFGGFGAKDVYWSSSPFTSADFVNPLINDLGITILRDNIPADFENTNDDADPSTTDLSKFSLNSLNNRLQYLKDLKAAGLRKLIVSIWSAPPWMKTHNRIENGAAANAAPDFNPNPTAADNQLHTDIYDEFAERCVAYFRILKQQTGLDNQLHTDIYDEFAERCVAYFRILKQQTGLDVYGITVQNEPRFSRTYESCAFNGQALADLIKVVGRRFKKEVLAVKIFVSEDVGWFDGINALIQPILNDTEAMSYVGFIATHGYAFDGVTTGSADAQTWKAMYNWAAAAGKPLWMTGTSGFANDMNGAMDLGKAMYTALVYGNVSPWLFWTISTSTLDGYSLMSSSGTKCKRYYVSKNFYRYIQPGAYRIGATAPEQSGVYAIAFKQDAEKTITILLINDTTSARAVKLIGAGCRLPGPCLQRMPQMIVKS